MWGVSLTTVTKVCSHTHLPASLIIPIVLTFFRLLWEVTSREDDRDASLSEEDTKPTLMYAKWMSSEDSKTDAILFVENYNIFYIPDVGVEDKKVYPVSQTEVVIPEVIFHGVPDWIYEGESIGYTVSVANFLRQKASYCFKNCYFDGSFDRL